MEHVEAAQAILAMNPLPADAEAQIDALYAQATPDEKPRFDEIYEGLFVRLNGADV